MLRIQVAPYSTTCMEAEEKVAFIHAMSNRMEVKLNLVDLHYPGFWYQEQDWVMVIYKLMVDYGGREGPFQSADLNFLLHFAYSHTQTAGCCFFTQQSVTQGRRHVFG